MICLLRRSNAPFLPPLSETIKSCLATVADILAEERILKKSTLFVGQDLEINEQIIPRFARHAVCFFNFALAKKKKLTCSCNIASSSPNGIPN